VALAFRSINPSLASDNGVIDLSDLDANSEISAYNPSSGFLYTVGGSSGAIVVSDLRNPKAPAAVAIATPGEGLETLQSAAVFGNLLAVAVQNTTKTDAGFVQFYNLTDPALPVHASTVIVGALPDMVKFSTDGSKLLVTNEDEPDALYTIDPVGLISLINTSGYLSDTPVAPRSGRCADRGLQRLGITTTVAQDIEPEAIAISADGK
jgi:hypothetical protein